jgi:hypothetical protein
MNDVGFPATDDDERWKQEADDLRHTGLNAIRESAGKWLESIAVILGVFSVVAFLKGPESLADLNDDVAYLLTCFVLAAALAAGVATWLAALASQGSPKVVRVLTGPELRKHVEGSYYRVARQLWWSRVLTVLAALLIAIGIGLAWFASISDTTAKTVNVLFVADDGAVTCGPVRNGAVALGPAGHSAPVQTDTVFIVKTCP